ncbi:MAG TPA: GAF domain-containing protein [Polyangiaceae bacterium]|nr:GAF domain-containing protein [Polyangiaceae bacterium]
MASVAVDLSPVVSSLLEQPFDQPSLDRAYTAVGGHPQAYATALRCAAKKTRDSLAAAYWFAEAARVHENMDDLGGAIALLWRAHECDRANPRPRELLAAAMVRLSMRAGLSFSFTPGALPAPATGGARASTPPGLVETGLRPRSLENRFRDTMPEALGADSTDPLSDKRRSDDGEEELVTGTVLRATLPSVVLPPASWQDDTEDADFDALSENRVEQLLPPPKNRSESGVMHVSRGPSGEPVLRSIAEAALAPPPSARAHDATTTPEPKDASPPVVFPEAGAKMAPMPSIVIGPEPATPEFTPARFGVEADAGSTGGEAQAVIALVTVARSAPAEGTAADDAPVTVARSQNSDDPPITVARSQNSDDPPATVARSQNSDDAPVTVARRGPAEATTAAPPSIDAKDAIDLTDDAELAPAVVHEPPPRRTAAARAALEGSEPSGATRPSIPPPADDVYAGDEAPPTLRPAGDRLVGGLFEALHGLHFHADVRHGADFVCRTLAEKMRPKTTLVHLYDINSGHYLVVSADGHRAAALVDYATPEDDAFIVEVMKGDDAELVQDPASDPRFGRGRWALVEPKRSVLCAPVARDGRHFGLLEVVDPADGGAFSDDDKNALMYAASTLSRFISRRGLVLSDEPERSSPGPIAG